MLQRIQTLFLAAAALLLAAGLFLPVWQYSAGGESEVMTLLQSARSAPEAAARLFFEHPDPLKSAAHSAALVLSLSAAGMMLFVIFQYRDRQRQMLLLYVVLFDLLLASLALVLSTQMAPDFLTSGGGAGQPGPGLLLWPAAIILAWMALRNIRKDEALVRSIDRIR